MSRTKEFFLEMCEDAVFQVEMGVSDSTFRQNIAYLAETQGVSMLKAIELANHFKLSIDSLRRKEAEINKITVAQEFLNLMSKT